MSCTRCANAGTWRCGSKISHERADVFFCSWDAIACVPVHTGADPNKSLRKQKKTFSPNPIQPHIIMQEFTHPCRHPCILKTPHKRTGMVACALIHTQDTHIHTYTHRHVHKHQGHTPDGQSLQLGNVKGWIHTYTHYTQCAHTPQPIHPLQNTHRHKDKDQHKDKNAPFHRSVLCGSVCREAACVPACGIPQDCVRAVHTRR